MKTNIICLVLLLSWQAMSYAQEPECGTILNQGQVDFMNATRSMREAVNVENFEDITLPLVAHIVRRSNGSGGLSTNDLGSGMDDLNTAFAQLGVQITLCETNYIDNDYFYNHYLQPSYSSGSPEFNLAIPNRVADKINIFFVPSARTSWSSFPSFMDLYDKDWTIVRNDHAINGSTLPHELGHYFNLYHTHQGPASSINIFAAELVDRSNCGPNVGDELCDTAADPSLSGCVNTFCQYVCNNTDTNGDTYQPDVRNLMSYSQKFCRTYFSPQQRKRMLQSLLHDRSNLSSDCLSCSGTSLILSTAIPSGSTEQYAVSNLIESTQTIHNNANATYQAGELIHLSPGFTARAGSTFRAYIADCNDGNTIANQFNAEPTTRIITQPISSAAETTAKNFQMSCYPNPLSNQAVIEFTLEEDMDVSLELFDMNGRKVQTILNSLQSKGSHKVDVHAGGLANGIYFARLNTKQQFTSLKILVHK